MEYGESRRIAYNRMSGESPGVVFLTGFKSDMTGGKALHVDALCKMRGQAFLRFDYTGHGQSSGKFEEGTIGSWLEDALAIFDAKTQGPQILVGSSMGGWIALLLALKRPERVAGIIGIAAAPDFTERLWEWFDDVQKKQLLSGSIAIPNCHGEEPYIITRELIEEGRRHLLLHAPIPITCPVRLLHGMQDEDVPHALSLKLAEKMASRDVEVTLVKGAGHRMSEPENLALLGRTLEEMLHRSGNGAKHGAST